MVVRGWSYRTTTTAVKTATNDTHQMRQETFPRCLFSADDPLAGSVRCEARLPPAAMWRGANYPTSQMQLLPARFILDTTRLLRLSRYIEATGSSPVVAPQKIMI